MFNVANPERASKFKLLTNATHYVVIDTCSKVEMMPDLKAEFGYSLRVCDTPQSFDQFANIQSMVLQTLMSYSRKPMFMLGGNFVNPKSLIESIDRNIPYLLVGTNQISEFGKLPQSLQEAFESVIEYVHKLRIRELKEGITID
jgi:hypothetical protein